MPDFPKAFSKEDREVLLKMWRRSKIGVWGFWIAIASLIVAISALVTTILC